MATVQIGATQHDVGDSVFLDANFLIASAASSETHHGLAALLMVQLELLHKQGLVAMYVSPMVLSETWWNLCKVEYEGQAGKGRWHQLQKQGKLREFALRWAGIHARTSFWLNTVGVEVAGVLPEDVQTASQKLMRYRLEPADAYHLAVIQRVGILTIITNDSDFSSISGLKHVPFRP